MRTTTNRTGFKSVLLLATCILFTGSAGAMSWFTPKEKVQQSNAKSVEEVQAQAKEKLSRVIEGEKTPVRPVVVSPQPSVSLRGDGNVYFQEAPKDERTTDQIYEEFLQRQAMREFNAKHPLHPNLYREETHYDSQAGAGAQSDKTLSESDSVKIPLWFNLLMFGVAALVLILVAKYALKQSAAATAIARAADQQLASWVRDNRSRATTSTDPQEIANLSSDSAEVEAARGRLAAELQKLGVKLG